MIPSADFSVLVLIPVYNDWEAVRLLLARLDEAVRGQSFTVEVLLIDDNSSESPQEGGWEAFTAIRRLSVLRLRRNLGHQRAIAIGLASVEGQSHQAVQIMDGDGEDDPRDIPRLVARLRENGGTRIVFAERTRRSEGLIFRAGYVTYRQLHWLLTGVSVRIGNFSIIPQHMVRQLVVLSELWNHYAAGVLKARIPHERIPTVRAKRLMGKSRMNLVALVIHGLSALSVFSEVIGVRLLFVSGLTTLGLMGAFAGIVGIRLLTDQAIPGWASTVGGLALVMLMQTLMLAGGFVFLILQGRGNTTFLPTRDHVYFVDRMCELWARPVCAASEEPLPPTPSPKRRGGAGQKSPARLAGPQG